MVPSHEREHRDRLSYPEAMPTLRRLVCLALAATSLAASSQALHLIPIPREVAPTALQPIPQGIRVTCATCFTDHDDEFTSQDLSQSLAARSIPTNGNVTVALLRVPTLGGLPPEAQPEGYTITPGSGGLTLTAATAAGLFYAAQTVKQLIEGDGTARGPASGHRPRLARDEVSRPARRSFARPGAYPGLSETSDPAALVL